MEYLFFRTDKIKKGIIIFIILLVSMIGLSNCNKDETVTPVYFYKNSNIPPYTLSLYIDGDYKGILKYIDFIPSCSDISLLDTLILVQLKAGKYTLTAKKPNDETIVDVKLKIANGDVKTSIPITGKGGVGKAYSDGCNFVFLTYE